LGRAGLESKGIARADEGRSWFRDLWPLLAVLAMIVAAALVVKRFLPGRRLWTGSGVLEIVTRTPLSPKQSLVLVKIGRHLVLVGVTPEQINTLCLVDDPEQVAMLLGEAASGRPGLMTQTFTRTLREEAGAYSHDPTERDVAAEAGTYVRGLLEKVRRFKRKREVA